HRARGLARRRAAAEARGVWCGEGENGRFPRLRRVACGRTGPAPGKACGRHAVFGGAPSVAIMDSANPYALRAGEVVVGYEFARVLGAGGFGITYEAYHLDAGTRVALKEYLPFGYGTRTPGASDVQSAPGEQGAVFRWGRERFIKEAQTL